MVYFVGAGSGDPELITIKGKKMLEKADVVIYAGSLVNKELLNYCKNNCKVFDSSKMTLKEVINEILNGVRENKVVVRLHTGDPSIYGAIREQMVLLDKEGIEYEVIPGVSSFVAAAAAIKKEYTLPGVTQTVILTRMEGRTPVPELERIELLAKHRASMAIFLSVHMIEKLAEKLLDGYGEDVPVAVVFKASWKEQKVINGNLSDIALKVVNEDIKNTALVLVGNFLGDSFEESLLYNESFTHMFRKGRD